LKASTLKGVDVPPHVVHVKGVTNGAHNTRSGRDMRPIGDAYTTQSGDPVSIYDAARSMDIVFTDSAAPCSP